MESVREASGSAHFLTSFLDTSQKYPHQIALCMKNDRGFETLTYSGLGRDVRRLAAGLREQGVNKGDRVVIWAENSLEWVRAYVGIMSAGGVAVPLDPKLGTDEFISLVRHCEPAVVFCSSSHLAEILRHAADLRIVRRVCVFGDPVAKEKAADVLLFSEMVSFGERPAVQAPGPDELASIVYTSGTTGEPKGVMLTHRNLDSSASALAEHTPIRPDDRVLLMLPFHHIYPTNILLACLLSGASVILTESMKTTEMIAALKEKRATVMIGVPRLYEMLHKRMLERICKEYKLKQTTVARLLSICGWAQRFFGKHLGRMVFKKLHTEFGGRIRTMASGGARLNAEVFNFFRNLGFLIQEGYGLTETAGAIVQNPRNGVLAGSAGRALPGTQIRIDEPDPQGIGEIVVSGPSVFKGYFKKPDASREVLRNGWFHTGDLGYIDRRGFVHITGRNKELIVLPSGKKVYPERLETIFGRSDLIKQIGIIGVDRGRGEEVFACIVPSTNGSSSDDRNAREITERRILEYLANISQNIRCHERITGHQFFYEDLPCTSTGKLKRHELHSMLKRTGSTRRNGSTCSPEFERDSFSSSLTAAVREILAKFCADAPIREDSLLTEDLGMDSLSILEFWCRVESRLEIKIKEQESSRLRTVGEVLQHLETRAAVADDQKISGPAGVQEDPWYGILDADSKAPQVLAESVLSSFPRLRRIFLKSIRWGFKKFSGLHAAGLEHLPQQGPFIIAANHECHLDNLFIASFLPPHLQQNICVFGKKEHFERRFTRFFAKLCHAVPVDRANVTTDVLRVGAAVLRRGKVLLIHPEGTRSPDGRLLPFRNGVSLLAVAMNCPVVPVFVEGAHEFWPKDSFFPKSRAKLSVRFGKPLVRAAGSEPGERKVFSEADAFTVRIREAVLALADESEAR